MATELATTSDRVQKYFEDLEAHKNILVTCTDLFTSLSNHFSSLQHSIDQKSQSIDSKLLSLQSHSSETLDALHRHETSLPERESVAAALINEHKEAALADLRNPLPGNLELPAMLKSLCRKMDSSALLRFIVSKRKESASLRAEMEESVKEAVDPPRLVLDAVEEFLNSKSAKSGVTDKRWACGILIQALSQDSGGGEKLPVYSRRILERATGLVELWKGQLVGESENGVVAPAEVVMFLQMVVCFGLRSRFDEEYLRKSVMEFASRRDMAKLAATLEFGDKMIDIIDELVKSGKEIEAVYFASESGLTERFPPVDLLNSYLKKNAATISKKGKNSQAATDESNTSEMNSIKAVIKCVEDHNLESEFGLDILRKRAAHMEKTRAERKKNSASGSKSKHKRAYAPSGNRGSGSRPSRPSKSARVNAYHSSSFSRRNNLAPSIQPSPAPPRFSGSYNYPSQNIYDGSTANPYAAATYGTSHSQSPAGITQQHYSLPVENLGLQSAYRTGSYAAGQSSYSLYDYGNTAPPTYQPPYTVDQTSYRG